MKGHGWQCDFEQCGKRAVEAGDPWSNPERPLPSGWYTVYGPAPADAPPGAVFVERHYCSTRCLAAAAAEQIGCRLIADEVHR